MQERPREVSVKNAKNQRKKVKARVRVHDLTESRALALDGKKSLERRRKDRGEGRNIGRKDGAEEMRKNGKDKGEGRKEGRKKLVYLSGDLSEEEVASVVASLSFQMFVFLKKRQHSAQNKSRFFPA